VLEVIEDRVGLRSTIVTSQLPVAMWHEALGEPTVADRILDGCSRTCTTSSWLGSPCLAALTPRTTPLLTPPPTMLGHPPRHGRRS
jgi:hypothetical protein